MTINSVSIHFYQIHLFYLVSPHTRRFRRIEILFCSNRYDSPYVYKYEYSICLDLYIVYKMYYIRIVTYYIISGKNRSRLGGFFAVIIRRFTFTRNLHGNASGRPARLYRFISASRVGWHGGEERSLPDRELCTHIYIYTICKRK